MAGEVSSADIARLERIIRSTKDSVESIQAESGRISAALSNVDEKVEKNTQELEELRKSFLVMVEEQRKNASLQKAVTELIRVRQELEQRYGNYKVVRETMLGVLQATDVALVRQTTISRVSEELMLSTPEYWLAPCLVAVSAWISNDRDLAERAIAEAVKRDEEKTALAMALICRRNGRTQTCYEWLARYFAKQDSAKFTEGTFTYIDAYVNGIFGPDENHMCDDYIAKWLNEIKGSSSCFEKDQEDTWSKYCCSFVQDISKEYSALAGLPEFEGISNYVGRISSVDEIKRSFSDIKTAYIDQDRLKAAIDKELINLISNYADMEESLKKEEEYYELVKAYDGNEDKAKAELLRRERARREESLDLVQQMTHAIIGKEDTLPSKRKTAVSFLSSYINKGYDKYISEKKGTFPEKITLSVDNWVGTLERNVTLEKVQTSYEAAMNEEKEKKLAAINRNSPRNWMIMAIVALLAGLVIFFSASGFLGGILLVWAGISALQISKSRKLIETSGASIQAEYDEKIARGKQQIALAQEQWSKICNIVTEFENNSNDKMVC